MNKFIYESPEISILELDTDIITTSDIGDIGGGSDDDVLDW